MQSPLMQIVPILNPVHYTLIFLRDGGQRGRVNARMWSVIVSGQEVGQNVQILKTGYMSHVETLYYLCFHVLFRQEMVNHLLLQQLRSMVIVEFFPFVHLQLERSSNVIKHPD